MVTASVTGLFRTILIIVGAFVLLRFIGQLMNAKRNVDEERDLNDRQRKFESERKKSSENLFLLFHLPSFCLPPAPLSLKKNYSSLFLDKLLLQGHG